jgi:hypothetical protein
MENQIITAQQVVDIVLSSASFDVALIERHIPISQRKYIKPTLGEDFYDEVIGMVDGTKSDIYNTLFNDYLTPCLAWFVMAEALPFIRTNITSAGVVTNRTEFAEQSDKSDYGSLRSSLISNAEWLRKEMTDYLVDNEDEFPLFENCEYKTRNRPGIILE